MPLKLRLFSSRYIGTLGGGIIIVAAISPMNAVSIAAEQSKHGYLYRQYRDEIGDYLPLPDYNKVSPFEEVPYTEYTGKKKKVIFDSIYTER